MDTPPIPSSESSNTKPSSPFKTVQLKTRVTKTRCKRVDLKERTRTSSIVALGVYLMPNIARAGSL